MLLLYDLLLNKEYDDYKDAEDAVHQMDGRTFEGQKIVVEPARKISLNQEGKKHDRREGDDDRERDSKRRRGPQPEDKCFNCGMTGHW